MQEPLLMRLERFLAHSACKPGYFHRLILKSSTPCIKLLLGLFHMLDAQLCFRLKINLNEEICGVQCSECQPNKLSRRQTSLLPCDLSHVFMLDIGFQPSLCRLSSEMEMRENEQFWLDPPGIEGLVPLVTGWQPIPPPSFMHASFMRRKWDNSDVCFSDGK